MREQIQYGLLIVMISRGLTISSRASPIGVTNRDSCEAISGPPQFTDGVGAHSSARLEERGVDEANL